jgi:outer membrane protein
MTKHLILILVALSLALMPLAASAQSLRIGIVDGMDIVSKSSEGKRVQDNIRKKGEDLGRPFAQKRQDLGRQVEDFQKQASVMKEDARRKKAEELEGKMREFERQAADADRQLAQFQEKELAPLLQKLEGAVKAVAQEEKLTLVLDKRNAGLLYMEPGLDVTEKVRAKFGR